MVTNSAKGFHRVQQSPTVPQKSGSFTAFELQWQPAFVMQLQCCYLRGSHLDPLQSGDLLQIY